MTAARTRLTAASCAASSAGSDSLDSTTQIETKNGSTVAYIAPGSQNIGAGTYTIAIGGTHNTICDFDSSIAAGTSNTVDAGSINTGKASFSFIGAGKQNSIASEFSAIGSGVSNAVTGSGGSFIGGGYGNTVNKGGDFIGAGGADSGGNSITNNDAFIGAGDGNVDGAFAGFIGAGESNTTLNGGSDSAIVSGSHNTLSGAYASILGGNRNVVSGEYASILGGFGSTASGAYAIVAGGDGDTAAGTASFVAGYHASAAHNGSFVWSDYTSGSATIKDAAANQFIVRASGGVFFASNEAATAGVKLAPGAGAWSMVSDRNAKIDFAALDDASILSKVVALPVTAWRYKSEKNVRHVGPMAQDFYAAFGVGEDDRHLTSIDEDGVAFAAIKALHSENVALRAKDAALLARLDRMERNAVAKDAETAAIRENLRTLEAGLASLQRRLPLPAHAP